MSEPADARLDATKPVLTAADFDYHLPEELIAQFPPATRNASRLLRLRGDVLEDHLFTELPDFLAAGDLLVFNDTRVIKARLLGSKSSGGQVEVLVERVLSEHDVLAHVRASHAPKPGGQLLLEGAITATMLARRDALFHLRFEGGEPVHELLEKHGRLPLPPYITHTADAADAERYQTVFAREPGAVAAPTAGLHFDQAMLDLLQARGVRTAWLTLHVGAGTFQPLRVDNIADHHMHAERFSIPRATRDLVAATRRAGGRVTAVGTTSLRALEAAADPDGSLTAGDGETEIFITPGYRFRVVDRLITNFHLPKSTLLMLVSAFAGMEPVRRAYRHAILQRYRFFSYGDAMLIDRSDGRC